eukprot:364325-Chlamydomonas_euryale.AAC.10
MQDYYDVSAAEEREDPLGWAQPLAPNSAAHSPFNSAKADATVQASLAVEASSPLPHAHSCLARPVST